MPYKNREEQIAYRKRYYAANKEKDNQRCKQYRVEHRDSLKEYEAEHRDKKIERYRLIRSEVLAHYGGKCAFCGDSNPNHLSIDHINNDGAEHRRKDRLNGGGMMWWLINNDFPEGFQILCHTHNFEKGRYGTMTPASY